MRKILNEFLFRRVDTSAVMKHSGVFMSRPRLVTLELTNCCNAACSFCLRASKRGGIRHGHMNEQVLTASVAPVAPWLELLCLNGWGEPLVHPQFMRMVDKCTRIAPDAALSFHTNGVLLDRAKIAEPLLEYKLASISISLDAVDQASYARLHGGRGRFDDVLRNIRGLTSAIAARQHSARVTVSYTIVPDNLWDLVEFVRLAAGLGVSAVGPVHLHNLIWGRDTFGAPADFSGAIAAALDLAANEAERLGVDLLAPDLTRHYPGSIGVDCMDGFACSWPIAYSPLVTWDGDVVLCCWRPLGSEYSLGNVDRDGLLNVWNGSRMRAVRRRLASGRLFLGCADCRLLGQDYLERPLAPLPE